MAPATCSHKRQAHTHVFNHAHTTTSTWCTTCNPQVLAVDASCAEAIACLAAEHFYSDQPELSIRYYRRLLQVRYWAGQT